ncbi:MAG: ketose-bisphosphate aldolase, partial [Desulfohalobiaceae bacterium]
GGDYKKLNLPFENRLLGQSKEIRDRMVKAVEDFVYYMISEVFNSKDTAPLAIQDILEQGSYDPGPMAKQIEDPAEWTREKILEKAKGLSSDKGPAGDYDD